MMGTILARFCCYREIRVLILGLDGSGKTVLLYSLKFDEIVETIPTIGFNIENINYGKVRFVFWDAGGLAKIRPLWPHYTKKTHVVMFVVDSAKKERMPEARKELKKILGLKNLTYTILAVLSNKIDPNSANQMTTDEIWEGLGLKDIKGDQKLAIFAVNAAETENLHKVLLWLQEQLIHP